MGEIDDQSLTVHTRKKYKKKEKKENCHHNKKKENKENCHHNKKKDKKMKNTKRDNFKYSMLYL